MKMKLKIIPQEIINQYQLQDLEENYWVYMKIVKGMAGLKQAARLANERLVHHLVTYGYAPVQHTPSLWKHESNGILFSLVVDDFGINPHQIQQQDTCYKHSETNIISLWIPAALNS